MRLVTPPLSLRQTADFEKRAFDYDKATPIQTQVAQAMAKRIVTADFPLHLSERSLIPQQQATEIWLDIGCGTGKLSEAVITEIDKMREQNQAAISAGLPHFSSNTSATMTYQLWGVDSSPSMLACYENKLNAVLAKSDFFDKFDKKVDTNFKPTNAPETASKTASNVPNSRRIKVQTCCADMRALPFLPQSAGLIMSSFALHWASPLVIIDLLNLLSPKGQLHMAIPVAGSFSHVATEFSELPIFPFLSEQAWLTALTENLPPESKVLYADSQSYSHGYVSLRALLKDLKQMGGTVGFDKSMDIKVLRHYLQSSMPVALDYQVLMVGVQR